MFEKLTKEFEKHDKAREDVIIKSRGVIKLSKKVISAVHKDDIKEAEKFMLDLDESLIEIRKKKDIAATGSYTIAIQEYLEAALLLEYAKTGKIIPYGKFQETPAEYILGLCDFVGELQRRAVVRVSKGDREEIKKIQKVVQKIYDGLLDFSFRGEVRKKFDLVKYVMIRLEEIMLELNLKK